MLFSVILPTYNRATRLKRALESLAAQTYKDFEVIVCDDGSIDNTKEVAESFKDQLELKYIWEENWGGPARPRNLGIAVARGDWICFLDSDDWWYPSKLEVTSRYLCDADVIYHDLDVKSLYTGTFYSRLLKQRTKTRKFVEPIFRDIMLNDSGIPNSSAVVRKSILIASGGLTEDKALIAVEDLDLWCKLSRLTEKFRYIPKSLGAYWVDGANISEVSEKQISRYVSLYNQHIRYLDSNDQVQAKALLCYNIGRIKYKNGLKAEAFKLFCDALNTKNRSIKIKALISIVFNYLEFRLF